MTRAVRLGLAVLMLGLAAVLLLVALDLRRIDSSFRSSDLAFQGRPRQADLWEPAQTLPFGVARRLLAIEDDLSFRRGVQMFRTAQATRETTLDYRYDPIRGRAQIALTGSATNDPDPRRRSIAENLLGIIAFSNAVRDQSTRETWLGNSAATFQSAIARDAENDDAKYNLELALVWLRAVDFDGTTISGGRRRGTFGGGAGAGSSGGGY
jgi:hypothetical protein